MRCDDQTIELIVGVVGEREHHPVLSAFAGANFDAADDAVGARCGGDLDAVSVAALMVEYRGEIDRRRVTADADGVDGARRRRGGNNHEAQREGRKAPDQTQCQFSAINDVSARNEPPGVIGARLARAEINDMKVKEIKGFPACLLYTSDA